MEWNWKGRSSVPAPPPKRIHLRTCHADGLLLVRTKGVASYLLIIASK